MHLNGLNGISGSVFSVRRGLQRVEVRAAAGGWVTRRCPRPHTIASIFENAAFHTLHPSATTNARACVSLCREVDCARKRDGGGGRQGATQSEETAGENRRGAHKIRGFARRGGAHQEEEEEEKESRKDCAAGKIFLHLSNAHFY